MSPPSGVLLVDKPAGPTSHDVVSQVRRRLGTRRVGHAGTLDPAATGLLVVLIEEGTKLAPYLTAESKTYLASVGFGRATDSLDATGVTTETGPVSPELRAELDAIGRGAPEPAWPRVAAALASERSRVAQVPPIFSAIHVDGVRSHALARAGETPALEPRAVRVLGARVLGARSEPQAALEIELSVDKGYYVRSFARDLGRALDVPAHLAALRRTTSGAFELRDAVALERVGPEAILPVADAAARALPVVRVDRDAEVHVRCGRAIPAPSDAPAGPLALLSSETGDLLAIAATEVGALRVLRGFSGRVA